MYSRSATGIDRGVSTPFQAILLAECKYISLSLAIMLLPNASIGVLLLCPREQAHVSGSEVQQLYEAVNVDRSAEINYNEVG